MKEVNRRRFLQALVAAFAGPALGGLGTSRPAWAQALPAGTEDEGGDEDRFVFAQLRYRDGEWDPNPTAFRALLDEVEERTSVETRGEREVLPPGSKEVFSFPFLYMAGRETFEPFTEAERKNLRTFLENGGTLLADDAVGHAGAGFDASFREEMRRIFPKRALRRLPSDHTVFRSFYLIRHVGGRRIVQPYLEGIRVGDVTPVIYCQNDLGGAWEKDPAGNWVYPCEPGGEPQRREAFKLGVNIVLYALTANYKQDKIHLPFIKRRVG